MDRDRIAEIIGEKYKSQAEMARKMGWNRQRLNSILTGRKEPDVADVVEFARALGRTVEETVGLFI